MKVTRRDYFNSEGYPQPVYYEVLKSIAEEERKRRYRPLVYICSPLSGDMAKNIEFAKLCCKEAVRLGFIPLASHLLYPQFMDDNNPEERKLALFFGKVLLSKCTELWICGDTVSKGMRSEIMFAARKFMKIRTFGFGDGKLNENYRGVVDILKKGE